MTNRIIGRLDSIDQIRNQLVTGLEGTQENLDSIKTLLKFKHEFETDHDQAKLNRYLERKAEFILAKRKLKFALIESIAQQVEKLNKELETGIDNLKKELDKLDNTITILETVERVIGIISRIVLLAR